MNSCVFILVFTILYAVVYVSCQVQSTFVKPLANGTCGISTGAPIVQQLTTQVSYAGGLYWSDFGAKIAYIDRYEAAMGRYTPDDGRFNHMQLNEGFESVAIIPVKNATGNGLKFVVGLDNRLVLVVVTGSGTDLVSTIYDLITVSNEPVKFKRGRCDNHGRLWYSSSGDRKSPNGQLYKIENLTVTQVTPCKLYGGAGMAWTKDYKNFYLVDSYIGIIYKYDFNEINGSLSNEKIIFRLSEQPNLTGRPFDIVLDTEGYLWIGMSKGGAVIQYDETTGSVLSTVAIPANDVVSVEFGGLDKKTLYVGTKKIYGQPASGAIFGVSGLGATGIPDNEIVIPEKYKDL